MFNVFSFHSEFRKRLNKVIYQEVVRFSIKNTVITIKFKSITNLENTNQSLFALSR